MGEHKLVTLRIDDDLYKQVRIEAIKKDIAVYEFVNRALQEELNKCKEKGTR